MATPSLIRQALTSYITSVVWVQNWGLQSPLATNPVVNNVDYPPNIGLLLPLENFELSRNSEYVDDSTLGRLLCAARFSLILVYVFHRDKYEKFHSLPIQQIEDLFCKLAQVLTIYDTKIHEDIINIKVPSQADIFTIPPPDDLPRTNGDMAAWQIRSKIILDIQFVTDPTEFTSLNFNKIQPALFNNPDGNPVITFPMPVIMKELQIDVNRAKINFDTKNSDTFTLDERILIDLNKSNLDT